MFLSRIDAIRPSIRAMLLITSCMCHVVMYWGVPSWGIMILDSRDDSGRGYSALEYGLQLLHESASPNRWIDEEGKHALGVVSPHIYVSSMQRDWTKSPDIVHSHTTFSGVSPQEKAPFEITMEQQPSMPPNTMAMDYNGSSLAAYKFAEIW